MRLPWVPAESLIWPEPTPVSSICWVEVSWIGFRDLRLRASTFHTSGQAIRAFEAGASGYVLKTSIRRELLEGIRTVASGGRFVCAEIAKEVAVQLFDERLTEREVQLLNLMAECNDSFPIAVWIAGTSHIRANSAIHEPLDFNHVRDFGCQIRHHEGLADDFHARLESTIPNGRVFGIARDK